MSDPFALLVDAANAKSDEEASKTSKLVGSSSSTGGTKESKLPVAAQHGAGVQADPNGIAKSQNGAKARALAEPDLTQGAIPQEQLEREAIERELAQQRNPSYGGIGGSGRETLHGLNAQEAEYMRQLRLEALVQQRRQETLAQLAYAQDLGGAGMGAHMHGLSHAEQQQLRQAALLRQEMMLSGGLRGSQFAGMHFMGGDHHERTTWREHELLEERLRAQRYEQQQHLASLGYGAARNPGLIAALASKGRPDLATSHVMTAHSPPLSSATDLPPPPDASKGDEKTTTIPCPARGLPDEHNPATAYFKIPLDIKHGTPLVCSYYACRNSGAQFKFCSTCNTPVSKWNFKRLHGHKQESDGANKLLKLLVEKGVEELETPTKMTKAPKKKVSPEAKIIFEGRRKHWEKLLVTRPKHGESTMIEWVQQVLAVSDVDTELPIPEKTSNVKTHPGERKLIKKRKLPINSSQHAKGLGYKSPSPKKNNHSSEDTAVKKEEIPDVMEMTKASTSEVGSAAEKSKVPLKNLKLSEVISAGETDDSSDHVPSDFLSKAKDAAMVKNPTSKTPEKSPSYDSDSGSSSSDDSVDLRANKRSS